MRARPILELLEPAGLKFLRDARRFGQEHGLAGSVRDQLRGYRQARLFGLDLLPPIELHRGLVVDIGANVGDFTAAVLAAEPRARVLAVEPSPATTTRLRHRFADDQRVTVDDHAVSAEAGTAILHVTSSSELASLHVPLEDIGEIYVGTDVKERVTVDTCRLDDLVSEPVSVLKIDVQGGEIPLLQGAEATLARTEAVLLEVLFVSHYEGDATFPALHKAMGAAGFVLRGLTPPAMHSGRAVWADACYVPAGQSPGRRPR